jgi:DNA polymerase-1
MKPYESIYDYYETIEKPIAQIFYAMSNRGISVDLEYLGRLRETLEAQKEPIEREVLNELGPINLNSPKQLLEALHEKGIFPTLKGKPSTDKRALEYHKGSSVVANLLRFSQLDTLLSSFVHPYLERNSSVVHPFFNQCGTRTGRLSCSNPNLLQIPKHSDNGKLVRKMFIPRSGMQLGDCDFGQIEPRVLAHFSKDPNLCGLFNDGVDFHTFTAEKLGIDRQRAKVLNLSVGYRATFKSVSQQLKCSDSEAQNEIDKWWNLFPVLRRWQDKLIYESRQSGFCATFMGRRIKVDRLESAQAWQRESAERQLINNITQGSAAEIMKKAMISIVKDKAMAHDTFGLLVQVYDELVFESENVLFDLPFVAGHMENCIKLDVPLVVDAKIGPNWGEVA